MTPQEEQEVLKLAKSTGAKVWQSYNKEDCGEYKQVDFTLAQLLAFVKRIRQEQREKDIAIVNTLLRKLRLLGSNDIAEAILKGQS